MAISKRKKHYRKKEKTEEEAEEVSQTIEELQELRKIRRKHGGLDVEKLFKGVEKKKKKKRPDDQWNADVGGLVDADAFRNKAEEEEGDKPKKFKLDAFTTQTNTLDVDKHMMDYIETEMRKRKGMSMEEEEEEEKSHKGLVDIYEELYRIPDRLKSTPKEESEGNVQLSTQMLTAIPEVDLGIDTRLKNIEETEKAKRKLIDDTQKEEKNGHQSVVRVNFEKQIPKTFKPRLDQKLMATDDQVAARFKKRMRN
ncbi:hepatocellular carcinoma-associated antigen 59-domain-containing protein [Pilobolus umbonatus]|nr:hepatocellular carcinoma-associated antigen 59-domain-containing protein [Pilobolus umbonatus]